MQKPFSNVRKSLNKGLLEKENISETLNNLPRQKFNMSIPNLLIPHNLIQQQEPEDLKKKPIKKHTLENFKNECVRSSQHLVVGVSKFSIPPINKPFINIEYQINEFENIRLLKDYSTDFITNMLREKQQPFQFLQKHQINHNLRAKMIDWMIQVFSSYKCLDVTFFKAVSIMDQFLKEVDIPQETKELHLIGVTCIFIAAKIEEIYPLKLKTVYEKIAHKKLSMQSIREKESLILEIFDFKVVDSNLYDFIKITIHTLNQQMKLGHKQLDQLQKICIYIGKMTVYQYSILSTYNDDIIAGSIILIGFKIFEQLIPTFCVDQNINKVYNLLKKDKQQVVDCSNKILKLVKGFDKIYPNLSNFKKFNKLNLESKDNKFIPF